MTNDEIILKALEHLIDDYEKACKEIEIPEKDFLYAIGKAVEKYEYSVARQIINQRAMESSIPAQQKARDRVEHPL